MKHPWLIFFWPPLLSLSAALPIHAAQPPGSKVADKKEAAQIAEAPADAEFWDLYDELADDSGRIPTPEDVPPPKEQLMPSSEPPTGAALEDL